jgi:hypothetical protein
MVAEFASESSEESPTTTWYNNPRTELTFVINNRESLKSLIGLRINEKWTICVMELKRT